MAAEKKKPKKLLFGIASYICYINLYQAFDCKTIAQALTRPRNVWDISEISQETQGQDEWMDGYYPSPQFSSQADVLCA